MSWLHALGFAHLNLKPKNILIDKHGVLKIADLGASLLLRDNQKLNLETRAIEISEDFHVVTSFYVVRDIQAPEHKKKSKEKFSQAMDVYSFATVLWYEFSRNFPQTW